MSRTYNRIKSDARNSTKTEFGYMKERNGPPNPSAFRKNHRNLTTVKHMQQVEGLNHTCHCGWCVNSKLRKEREIQISLREQVNEL